MTTETYIHEFRSLPHPGDFGIPKGHWWQAKAYAYHHADQLCAFTPKREWVGLTDTELVAAYMSVGDKEWAIAGMEDATKFAKAIEAKLKKLNT